MAVVQRYFELLISALLLSALPASAWSQQYVFARGNSAPAGDAVVTFEDAKTDPDNLFNQTNGRFTPTEAGTYYINASALTYCSNATGQLRLRKNGTSLHYSQAYSRFSSDALVDQLDVGGVVDLNGSGDYVDIYWSGGTCSLNNPWVVGQHTFTAFAIGGGGGSGDNLGDHTATQDLMMGGNSVQDAAGYFHGSDLRLKTDLQPISGLSIIEQLTGYSFTLKRDGRKSSGIVAQELEKVMPQAVVTDPKTGMKMVEYDQIIAPLIEATKELGAKNAALEEDMRAMREEMRELKETR